MNTPWRPKIEILADGEQVNAVVANRPIQELSDQTRSLQERLSNLSPGSGRVVFANAPLDPAVTAMDCVYFDSDELKFRPAIAEVQQDASGRFLAGPKSMVVGMVLSKSNSTTGDILLLGRLNLETEGIDPSTLVDDPILTPFRSGRFYLSKRVAGKLTASISTPCIQVGFFTTGECHIQPLQKDLFQSHDHFRFSMTARPAASQNYAKTGWSALGVVGDEAIKHVDYYNQGGAVTPPQIILCIKPNGSLPAAEDSPIRVELFNSGGQLNVELMTGGLDYLAPNGAATNTAAQTPRNWPAYGEWIDIPDTNLSVSFIRADGTYSGSLATDAAALLTSDSKRFKVYLPLDLKGWANANPLDLLITPPGTLYHYLLESDDDLRRAFPPLPVSSALIEQNGQNLSPGDDFIVTASGIFWVPGRVTGDYSPWPSDYASNHSSMTLVNARNLNFHFIKSGLDDRDALVFSLKGIPPVKVVRCPSGLPGSTGDLQISIDLSMLIRDADPINSTTTLVNVNGQTFNLGWMVSEIVSGTGIRFDLLSENANGRGVGKIRINRNDLKFEGELTSVALRNAKVARNDSYPVAAYIDFLPPAQAASGITAGFKLPNADLDPLTMKMKVSSMIRGDMAVLSGVAEKTAIFKVSYHALRPGFAMNSMNDGNAVAVQYWKVKFPASYMAGTILANEAPYDATDADAFQIDPGTLTANPSSLVALSGGFALGDRIAVQIDRVAQDGSGNVDDYAGRVGFLGLRWILP